MKFQEIQNEIFTLLFKIKPSGFAYVYNLGTLSDGDVKLALKRSASYKLMEKN